MSWTCHLTHGSLQSSECIWWAWLWETPAFSASHTRKRNDQYTDGWRGKFSFIPFCTLATNEPRAGVRIHMVLHWTSSRCWCSLAWAGKEAPYNNRDSTLSLGRKISVLFLNCNERLFVASPRLFSWSDTDFGITENVLVANRLPWWSSRE